MSKPRKGGLVKDAGLRTYYDRTCSLESDRRLERVRLVMPKPRRLVALRLEEETLDSIRRLALQKGLNYSTLMRMWLTERLRQEES